MGQGFMTGVSVDVRGLSTLYLHGSLSKEQTVDLEHNPASFRLG
jgi:hypothetical protein